MAALILTELRGRILIVTLNRPSVLNAVSPELRAAFIAAMKAADIDDAVGAVVITGAGKAFSAGQDLNETANLSMDQVRGWCTALRDLYQSVRDLSKPAVAAWNGIAAGAGMQIGLSCDVRVTHPGARIGQPEVAHPADHLAVNPLQDFFQRAVPGAPGEVTQFVAQSS